MQHSPIIMGIIQLRGVTKNFGGTPVLSGVSLDINQGNKIGIIGLNGSGKTTLLQLMNGELEPDKGEVIRQRNLRIAYAAQTLDTDLHKTILELCYNQHPDFFKIREKILYCEKRMAEPSFDKSEDMQKVVRQYSEALERFEERGGYTLESVIATKLQGVLLGNLTPDRVLEELSAGELKIAQIASAISTDPDLLLIDEPTNHADPVTSEAIDNLIVNFKGTIVYATHDRYLLNKTAGRIVETRRSNIIEFEGTYDEYVEFRQNSYEADLRKYKAQKQIKTKLRDSMLRLKSKGAAGYDKPAKRAKDMERRLERMDLKKPAQVTDNLRANINYDKRGGTIVLRAKGLQKRFENREVLSGVDFEIYTGQRIGIVGNSGSGKTTLLNCLLGYESLDSGSVWTGPSIITGYLSQANLTIDYNATIHDELKKAGCTEINRAYGLLKSWLFRERDLDRKVGELSGGEKKKVQLMKIMLTRPNLLVLDEPTDHLDMASREGLEKAAKDFDGTLLVASHDRYFLDVVTDTTLLLIKNSLLTLPGNYTNNLDKINKYLGGN